MSANTENTITKLREAKKRSTGRLRLRTAALFAVACVLLGCLGWWQYFDWTKDEGVGPAGPTVDPRPFQRVWTTQKVHVLGLGDSITAGLGAKSRDHSYFERLIANPADEWADMQGICLSQVLPNLTSSNLAVSGSESRQHGEIIQELPELNDAFGIVLMTSGGNDLIHMYGRSPPRECAMYGARLQESLPWIDRFEERLRETLNTIISRYPDGCEIYLADIYDPTDGTGDAASIYLPHWEDGLEIHGRYNARINRVAAEFPNVFLVPLHHTFLGHGSEYRKFWTPYYDAEDPTHWYFENIEDPNDRGYDAIRRIFLNAIAEHSSLREM